MILLLSAIHVIVCLFLILVVLLQQGKGADLSVFGGGGTQAAFGARGAATLLHKLTVISFIVFAFTTMGIGLLQNSGGSSGSVMSEVPAAVEETAEEAAAPVLEETEAAVEEAAAAADAMVEGAAGEVAEEEDSAAAEAGEAGDAAAEDDGSQQ